MTKFLKSILIAIGILASAGISQAQFSGQISEYDDLPQRVYANPALRPSGHINIGIPALSNIQFEHANNWFRPSTYINSDANGTATIDAGKMLETIGDAAQTGLGLNLELLHVGLRFKKHYFHFRAAERIQFDLTLPRDIFALAAYGNINNSEFENNTADLSGLGVNGIHFREYSLGYNYEMNEQWSFGATAKYLYGMERIYTAESSLQLRTDPNTYALQTSGAFVLNTSGIYGSTTEGETGIHDDLGNYITGLKNRGLGIDLGVVYRPIEKLEIQISGHDIGFIRWREDIANYGTTDASFAYDGIDLTEFIFLEGSDFNNAFDAELERLTDELESTYNFERTTESFRTPLNGFLRYGASYDLYETEKHSGSAWVNLHHRIGKSVIPTRLAFGYSQKLWGALQGGVHYSKQFGNSGFLGCGLSANLGAFQIFGMVENLRFTRFTRITLIDGDDPEQTTEITFPSNGGDIRVQFGLNLTFGRKKSDQVARPMIR